MKYAKFFTTYFIIAALLVYTCFAFAIWQLNPAKWDSVDRGAMVFVVILLCVFSLPASSMIED